MTRIRATLTVTIERPDGTSTTVAETAAGTTGDNPAIPVVPDAAMVIGRATGSVLSRLDVADVDVSLQLVP